VGVSPTGDFWFSVGVSPTETGIFPHWFLFSAGRLSGRHRAGFGVFGGSDVLPIVGRFTVIRSLVCQPEFVRRPVLGITGAAMLGDFGKAKSLDFAHGWRDRVPVNAVFLKLCEGHGQVAVVPPGVMSQLNLQAVEQAMAGKT
jgi:hypothetical protein